MQWGVRTVGSLAPQVGFEPTIRRGGLTANRFTTELFLQPFPASACLQETLSLKRNAPCLVTLGVDDVPGATIPSIPSNTSVVL